MDRQLLIAELDDIARQLANHADRYQPLDLGDLAERLREAITQISGPREAEKSPPPSGGVAAGHVSDQRQDADYDRAKAEWFEENVLTEDGHG